MNTELRPLIGKRMAGGGVEYVHYPMDQVMYKCRQVGLLGHSEGANVTFLASADPATFDEIKRDVVVLRDGLAINEKHARAQPLPPELQPDEGDEDE